MAVRAGRQIRVHLRVHLVFVTKWSGEVFGREAIDDLAGMFADICQSFDADLQFCAGGSDWVRLTVAYNPTVELAVLINSLKTVSSRLIRKAGYPGIAAAIDAAKGALWSPSYLAVAGDAGEVEELVLNFVEEQGGGPLL
jgi:putative transposase